VVLRKKIPTSVVVPGHPDYELLTSIAGEIDRKAGGRATLASEMPLMLRDCIDALINTPRTGRRDFNELEKVEKTFIGTHVEIVVRRFLRLEKGLLDTVILGHDVDIKFTTGDNWTIPPEAYNHPCLIIAADEERSLCYMGLIVIRPGVMHGARAIETRSAESARLASSISSGCYAITPIHPISGARWTALPWSGSQPPVTATSGWQRCLRRCRAARSPAT